MNQMRLDNDDSVQDVLIKFGEKLRDKLWRMSHLYWIEDKDGRKVRFALKDAQIKLHRKLWHRNDVLKARQLGISTYCSIFALDEMLFVDGFHAGCVDKSLPDAAKKLGKMKFAWNMLEYLPPNPTDEDRWLAVLGRAIKMRTGVLVGGKLRIPFSNSTRMEFSNGSDVEVGVSLRGGTVHFLHLSEFGHVAAHYPIKAKEILAGATEAVPKSGIIINESTHEGGSGGANYELMKGAMDNAGKMLSQLQHRFFFFPWYDDPEYRLPGKYLVQSEEDKQYFNQLEEDLGIVLDDEQRRWYIDKKSTLGDLMQQENPSTPEEALMPSVQGAIYGAMMRKRRSAGCVGVEFEYEPGYPIYTSWDLGVNDAMAIWAVQFVGLTVRLLHFHQDSGKELGAYVDAVWKWERELGCTFKAHYLPHDGTKKQLDMTDAISILKKKGLNNVTVVPRIPRIWTGINNVRDLMKNMVFHSRCLLPIRRDDGEKMMSGVDCLCTYHKKTVLEDGISRDVPVHDGSSHGCDALRTIAEAWARGMVSEKSRTDDAPANAIAAMGSGMDQRWSRGGGGFAAM